MTEGKEKECRLWSHLTLWKTTVSSCKKRTFPHSLHPFNCEQYCLHITVTIKFEPHSKKNHATTFDCLLPQSSDVIVWACYSFMFSKNQWQNIASKMSLILSPWVSLEYSLGVRAHTGNSSLAVLLIELHYQFLHGWYSVLKHSYYCPLHLFGPMLESLYWS